jgi:hypothetical protein
MPKPYGFSDMAISKLFISLILQENIRKTSSAESRMATLGWVAVSGKKMGRIYITEEKGKMALQLG